LQHPFFIRVRIIRGPGKLGPGWLGPDWRLGVLLHALILPAGRMGFLEESRKLSL
jgi:hypothetical protein